MDILLDAWENEVDGEEIVATLAMAATPLLDYEFLLRVSERIDASSSDDERARLEDIRALVLEVQEQQQQNRTSVAQQTQAVLQEVLQASDTAAKLEELSDYIDENFLALLATQIQAAEQKGATAAVRRFTSVYEQALTLVQGNLPPELQLINQLLGAQDPSAARALLKENRQLLNKEFLASLSSLEAEMRSGNRSELADRLKSLRGQIALMI